MRLDRYLSEAGVASRRQAAALIKRGAVTVDGGIASRVDAVVTPGVSRVMLNGEEVDWRENWYLMLNKPEGYVSSTDDPGAPTVLTLLPEKYARFALFPCGRLDRNTTGLMLLTTDGPLAHHLLSPKHHVTKRYRYEVKYPLSEADVAALEQGIEIEGGYTTLPCRVFPEGERQGVIELTEGKYHQIKLMMKAVHNQVRSLCRISFGPLTLDENLELGKVRELSEEEISALRRAQTEKL